PCTSGRRSGTTAARARRPARRRAPGSSLARPRRGPARGWAWARGRRPCGHRRRRGGSPGPPPGPTRSGGPSPPSDIAGRSWISCPSGPARGDRIGNSPARLLFEHLDLVAELGRGLVILGRDGPLELIAEIDQ